MATVLASTYPSGRPKEFRVLADNDGYVETLVESFGYSIVATGKNDDYSVTDAWWEFTYVDSDGMTRWRKG